MTDRRTPQLFIKNLIAATCFGSH